MGKDKWGTKRQCQACDSKYYDMNKAPGICPNCETVFEAKSAKALAADAVRAAPPAAAKRLADAADLDDPKKASKNEPDDAVSPDGDTADDADDDDDDEGLIEDPSELGEDEDDVAVAVDAGTDKKEAQP